MSDASLQIEWLGRVPYAEALELQLRRLEARRQGEGADVLLLLEHPPVITLGPGAKAQNLLLPRDVLAAQGVEVHSVRRGGDFTYHAPGQLVGYLIVDLAARGDPDVRKFLCGIEGCLMDALEELQVPARRIEGKTGVFIDRARADGDEAVGLERKIASIGVGLRRWISYHGFALNVSTDLRGFERIVPCGLQGVRMTSVAEEGGGGSRSVGDPGSGEVDAVARWHVARAFARHFG